MHSLFYLKKHTHTHCFQRDFVTDEKQPVALWKPGLWLEGWHPFKNLCMVLCFSCESEFYAFSNKEERIQCLLGIEDPAQLLTKNPGWCGLVTWVSSHEPKGRWFDFWSGHMPEFLNPFPVGGMLIDVSPSYWYFLFTLSFLLKINLKN